MNGLIKILEWGSKLDISYWGMQALGLYALGIALFSGREDKWIIFLLVVVLMRITQVERKIDKLKKDQ